MPRRYREQPLMSIWEGSGNVMCLDVLRAIRRNPETVDAFLDEVAAAEGADRRLDEHAARLANELRGDPTEHSARRLVEDMALALQAGLLVRHAPHAVADAFCSSRLGLGNPQYLQYGTLASTVDSEPIISRHTVEAG